MAIIRWKVPCKGGPRRFCTRIRKFIAVMMSQVPDVINRITFALCCLTYNDHMSYNYTIDFFLEPLYWFVDNFAKYLGKVFVFCVSILTAAVVATAYWVGLPYWWQRCPYTSVFLIIFGNWLLLNIIFHYYMGVVTPPGYPPSSFQVTDVASICKKCIAPKPQRTHHCSVCDRCILAMDHHCPWLNNCVGYFNARYFFLYMAYMLAGVTFIIVAGLDLGYSVLWLNDTGVLVPNNDPDLIGHPVRINQSGAIIPIKEFVEYDAVNFPRVHHLPIPPITEAQRVAAHPWKRKAVIFMAVTCVGVFFALGTLTIMHGKNIGRGETSVESHTNARLRVIQRNYFRNPYNFGRKKNWKIFLGLTQGRTFFRHVLFPSAHQPTGNGVVWHNVHNVLTVEDWP